MNNIGDILEKQKLKTGRKKDCLFSFYEKVSRAVELVNFAERSKSRKIISESRRQFIIALVTALEVYISDIVIELISKSRKLKENLVSLSTDKYSLQDIYDIKKYKITIGELVILSNNFQNLNVIERVFSTIFKDIEDNFNLFKFLNTHLFFYRNNKNKEIAFAVSRDVFQRLNQILRERHTFVHDITFKNTPAYAHLAESRVIIIDFVHCIEILSNTITKKRKNRFEKIK